MYRRTGFGDAASAAIGGGISAGVALATNAASMWLNSITLSHQADTATTQIVNGLEPLLNANKNAYLNGPGTCADQAAALAAFDTAIQWLRSPQACGNGAYGSAGNRCISDRLCESGCKFPWIAWYRDPIANDPRVSCAVDPAAAEAAAIQNLRNLASGSNQQVTPGMYSTSGSTTSGGVQTVADVSTFLTQPVLGFPLWLVLLALGITVAVI